MLTAWFRFIYFLHISLLRHKHLQNGILPCRQTLPKLNVYVVYILQVSAERIVRFLPTSLFSSSSSSSSASSSSTIFFLRFFSLRFFFLSFKFHHASRALISTTRFKVKTKQKKRRKNKASIQKPKPKIHETHKMFV